MQCPEYMPENTLRCGPLILRMLLTHACTHASPCLTPGCFCSYASFIGGAILAKTVFPQNQHVTKHDYHEMGPTAVSRRMG